MSKIDTARIHAIQKYLESSFAGASLQFAIGKRAGRPDSYSYKVETDVDTHTLVMSHELLEGGGGSIEEYLLRHDVAAALRRAGDARVIITTLGLCTEPLRGQRVPVRPGLAQAS